MAELVQHCDERSTRSAHGTRRLALCHAEASYNQELARAPARGVDCVTKGSVGSQTLQSEFGAGTRGELSDVSMGG